MGLQLGFYPRYKQLFPVVKEVRDGLDKDLSAKQPEVEAKAVALYKTNPAEAVRYLTSYSAERGATMLTTWKALGERLIVEFNDMTIKPAKDGKYLRTKEGLPVRPKRVGYPDSYRKVIVDQTGDKYLLPGQ